MTGHRRAGRSSAGRARLVAGSAIIWGALVGATLGGCDSGTARPPAVSPVSFYEWRLERSSGVNGVFNSIGFLQPYDIDARRFVYLTGGEAGVTDDDSVLKARGQIPPRRVVAEHRTDTAVVRVLAFDNGIVDQAQPAARWIAESLDRTTTQVWPGRVSVVVDIHVMPDDAVFSLARRVAWTDGQPYTLAIFVRESLFAESKGNAVHELYHVLAIRWSIGAKGPLAKTRYDAASAYEEVAARLYGACGELLVDGVLARPKQAVSGSVNSRALQFPLAGDDLRFVLDMVEAADRDMQLGQGIFLGKFLELMPILHVFGDRELIGVDSDEGRKLLDLCRQFSGDPLALEPCLRELTNQ